MKKPFVLPFEKIGEPSWVEKLQTYLKGNGLTCKGESLAAIENAEAKLELQIPGQIREYYLHFGNTSSSDYMYNLKPASELVRLFAANWAFIDLNFLMSDINKMIVFSESPGRDPLCFDFETGAIYLFSHDPVKKAKVFADFSQYVVHELLETERLVGDSGLSEKDISQLSEDYLAGEGIDYDFRAMKL